MEVPRFWRNNDYMLNPNKNGYRAMRNFAGLEKISEPSDSAKITCITYNGTDESYTLREVKPYSQILKNDIEALQQPKIDEIGSILIEIKIPSGIIYQNTQIEV